MSMQDPIADMLTRIRNAQAVKEQQVMLPSSKVKQAILQVLQAEGFIRSYEEIIDAGKHNLKVVLAYFQNQPVIHKIKRISKVGLRIYRGSDELPVVNAGMGISIVSTSQGVMSGKEAKARKLGGEVLCTVE